MESRHSQLEQEILTGIMKRLASPLWLQNLRSSGTTKIGNLNASVFDIESQAINPEDVDQIYKDYSAKQDSEKIADRQVAINSTDGQLVNATIYSRITRGSLAKDFGINASDLNYREQLLLNDVCFDVTNSIYISRTKNGDKSPTLNADILTATRNALNGIDFSQIRLGTQMQFEVNPHVLEQMLQNQQPELSGDAMHSAVDSLKASAESDAEKIIAEQTKQREAELEKKRAIHEREQQADREREQAPQLLEQLREEIRSESDIIQKQGSFKDKRENKAFTKEVNDILKMPDSQISAYGKLQQIRAAKEEYDAKKPDLSASEKSSKMGLFGTIRHAVSGRRHSAPDAANQEKGQKNPKQSWSLPTPGKKGGDNSNN